MPERDAAQDRLERILHILPAAGRDGGARLDELADDLGVSVSQIIDDINHVLAREFYHPAGGAEGLQINLESDRVTLWTSGDFRRPPRLSLREALALGLALRARAADRTGERREALIALAHRLESELASADPEDIEDAVDRFGVDDGVGAGRGLRGFFRDAVEDRCRCRIRYLKPGGEAPDDRVVHPYKLAFAEGAWYLIAHCESVEDVRVFRLDRILDGEDVDGASDAFDVPDDFDLEDWVAAGGRIYYAEDDVEVAVRYSSNVARWIAERERFELLDDGGILVRHRVADPQWLVRHVLRYGPDAEVMQPEELRSLVWKAVAALVG